MRQTLEFDAALFIFASRTPGLPLQKSGALGPPLPGSPTDDKTVRTQLEAEVVQLVLQLLQLLLVHLTNGSPGEKTIS